MIFTANQHPSQMSSQPTQQEKLQEIGSKIRQVRETQGVSIEEVAKQTRIQARLLIAIEQGQLEELPEPVYIRGLMKRFADAIGLDGAKYAQEFSTAANSNTVNPSWQKAPTTQLRPLHLYFIYLLLVVLSIWGLSLIIDQRLAPKESQESHNSQPQTTHNPLQKEVANVQSSQNSAVKIKVSIENDTWLQVISDGEQVYEGELSAGENRTWTAQEELTLHTKDTGGLIVEYHQQQSAKFEKGSDLSTITYSPVN